MLDEIYIYVSSNNKVHDIFGKESSGKFEAELFE